MTDDALMTLKTLKVAGPSPEAKKLALNAAMVAFDAAQAAGPRKANAGRRGWFASRWSLGAGVAGLGTVAAALVLLPLGTQLYNTTSHGPVEPALKTTTLAATSGASAVAQTGGSAAVLAQTEQGGPVLAAKAPPVMQKASPPMTEPVPAMAPRAVGIGNMDAPTAPENRALAVPASPNETEAADALASVGDVDLAVQSDQPSPVALGLTQATQPSGDTFQKFDESRVKVTSEEPVSTFSIDVDTASYSYVRGLLEAGSLPEPDAVRLEEMINYFPYDYPAPTSLDTPFKATMAVIPTPWNPKTQLLEIGIKGYVPPATARQPENLTFLIDTSGSMDEPNKLPLLKRAFGLLVDTLQPSDTVSIVTYAGSAGEVLPPTKASDRSTILSARWTILSREARPTAPTALRWPIGSTPKAKIDGGINRVILATDGDFNVGIDTPDELKTFIKGKRDSGISLSVLGFGRGNLDDALMQALAQNGNGNASYIDNFQEAQKVLVEEGGANMVTIAKDVKIQVEFNPAQVSEYRLIGYETRALNREDFNNDAVDAGEIGAGHTVTALYEITPTGTPGQVDALRYASSAAPDATSSELGFLKIRYKAPDGDVSKLVTTPITRIWR